MLYFKDHLQQNSLGCFLKRHVPKLHFRHSGSELLWAEPRNLNFNQHPKGFLCKVKLENNCLKKVECQEFSCHQFSKRILSINRASLVAQMVKNLPAMREAWVHPWVRRCPGGGNRYPLQYSCLESYMDIEEPGMLQSLGSQRVGHD